MRRKVRCLDVGVGKQGLEIQALVREIFPALGIVDYEVHGFEPWSEAYEASSRALAGFPGVSIHRLAIADREGECNLYMASRPDGHSIFPTKYNVPDARKFEVVPCTRISVWIRRNLPDLPASLNILRFNAEGGEWPLFADLDAEGLLPSFSVVCGACGRDIRVVRELSEAGCYDRFLEILERNGISMFRFCGSGRPDAASRREMRRRLQALLAADARPR